MVGIAIVGGGLLADELAEVAGVTAAFGDRWLMWSSSVKRLFGPPDTPPTGVVRPVLLILGPMSCGDETKPLVRCCPPPPPPSDS